MVNKYNWDNIKFQLWLRFLKLCVYSILSDAEKVLATVSNIDVLMSDVLFLEVIRPRDISYTFKIRPAKNFGVSFVSIFCFMHS